jgi:hypothetical protein
MKTRTKIIGGAILIGTVAGIIYLNGKKNTPHKGRYLDDNPESNAIIIFDPKLTAQKLYEAMKTAGTDEDYIFETLTGVSQTQFGAVIKAFGLKTYNSITGNQYGVIGTTLPKRDLKYWLKNELEDNQYKLLRTKYPNYL